MEKQFKNIALTTLSLLSIGLATEIVQASALVMGKDSAMASSGSLKIADYNLALDSAFLEMASDKMPTSLTTSFSLTNKRQNFNNFSKISSQEGNSQSKEIDKTLAITDQNLITSTRSFDQLDLQTIDHYLIPYSEASPTKIVDANAINQSIQDRYQNLVKSDTGKMNLMLAKKLLSTETALELATQITNTSLITQQPLALIPSIGLLEAIPQQNKNVTKFLKPLFAAILLLIDWRGYYIVKAFK